MLIVTPSVGPFGKVFAVVTEVMTAKELCPPPLRVQKRSGFSLAFAVTHLPSAVPVEPPGPAYFLTNLTFLKL